MEIDLLTVGEYQTNCYLIYHESIRDAIIIDPGFEGERIISRIKELELVPQIIVITHAHFDHISAIPELSAVYNLPLAIHRDDVSRLADPNQNFSGVSGCFISLKADIELEEGDLVEVPGVSLEVIHTPGHSTGSIILVNHDERLLFSGDTLFYKGYGRVDLPGSSSKQLRESLEKIKQLPDDFKVFPGHGPATTIGGEKNLIDYYL
ncbi:MBL fold metallo-hydrolase [bacterium]|nr:MBL fold metallo-hydrolase [bacterium]